MENRIGLHDHIGQLNLQNTAVFLHGMTGVDTEVHQQLVDLNRFGKDHSGRRLGMLSDVNRLRQGGPDEFHDLLDNRYDLQRSWLLFLLPAEREDLFHQVSGAPAGFEDFLKVVLGSTIFRNLDQSHLRIAQDGSKNIIKIMGYSSRKRAHRFHLLEMAELLLQVLLFRVVNDKSLDLDQASAAVEAADNIFDGVNDPTIQAPILPWVVLQYSASLATS